MIAVTILLVSIALLLLLPISVLAVEIFVAVLAPPVPNQELGRRGRLAVLIPAHNEAGSIAATLSKILPQLAPNDRLVVVADNCSDDTGDIARASGAEVIARNDATRRGKGYALDFGVRHLEDNNPETVIIIDADCAVTEGCINTLARCCSRTARPVQALYLMHSPYGAGLKTRVAEFAWTVKNLVRASGLHRMGLPCQLMGTGMAFPWTCLSSANLATGHIVEDLVLGIEMTRAKRPPLLCPEALVTSMFPSSNEGIQSQRARWEHGHLGILVVEAPKLFWEACKLRNMQLLSTALDLSIPPLALLAIMVAALWLSSAVGFVFTKSAAALTVATIEALMLAATIIAAWLAHGQRIISLRDLALASIYVVWKIPIYTKFFVARQVTWVRSRRDTEDR